MTGQATTRTKTRMADKQQQSLSDLGELPQLLMFILNNLQNQKDPQRLDKLQLVLRLGWLISSNSHYLTLVSYLNY